MHQLQIEPGGKVLVEGKHGHFRPPLAPLAGLGGAPVIGPASPVTVIVTIVLVVVVVVVVRVVVVIISEFHHASFATAVAVQP